MKTSSQRYFKDYESRIVETPDGKLRKELVYTGDTYAADMPADEYRNRNILFTLFSAGCAVLFVVANMQPVESNIEGRMPVLGLLVVIPLFLLCYGAVVMFFKKQTLKKTDYIETSMMIKCGGFFTLALAGFDFIWHLSCLMNLPAGERGRELFVALCWLFVTALSMTVWIMEMRTHYVIRNRYGNVVHHEAFRRGN